MTATTSTAQCSASQKEQQIAEQKAREQLEASGVTPEYQQMLEECESYIQKIHQCNLDLPVKSSQPS